MDGVDDGAGWVVKDWFGSGSNSVCHAALCAAVFGALRKRGVWVNRWLEKAPVVLPGILLVA